MRQALGEKKVKRLGEKLGLPIIRAVVRGGTDHRIDFRIDGDDSVYSLNRDGTIEKITGVIWGKL